MVNSSDIQLFSAQKIFLQLEEQNLSDVEVHVTSSTFLCILTFPITAIYYWRHPKWS